jgi:nitrogen regulatory protein PII
VDGGYSEEALKVIQHSISSWASHTINYDIERIRKYQEMGIEDWLYGPMLYESRINSWVGSSTFLDLPLVNDRAISWSCRKYHTYSWISWGIGAGWKAAWYDTETWKDTNKKCNGNGMLIYAPGIVPNVRGACPSIRLKTMRDGVEEYELMRLLSELDGNDDRVNEIINSIIKEPFGTGSIGNLDVWVYDAELWDRQRIRMGNLIEESAR